MKMVIFVAAIIASGATFADLLVPLTDGVECAVVDKDATGKPDLANFNKQLKKRSGGNVALASVSVSPLANGKYLACTTGVGKKED